MHVEKDCPWRLKCHGGAKWCVVCGDVAHVCDDRRCAIHLRGDELREYERRARVEFEIAKTEAREKMQKLREACRAAREYDDGNVCMVARSPLGVMVHNFGEKIVEYVGLGRYANVICVYEYEQSRYVVGRRYTAVEGQELVETIVVASRELAVFQAERMSREISD